MRLAGMHFIFSGSGAAPADPQGLILSPAESARQDAARRDRQRLASDSAARLLGLQARSLPRPASW